ncbi:fimbrial protein, partial [Serratia marcescens]|uniref:fimbrial protein n=1 Tax=Serratia marcescens TaxID=615 RepID=UPI0011E6F851
DTGTITFTGAVTDTTCNVDIGGAGAEANVKLPTVSKDSLATASSVSGKTQFTISLSGCAGAASTAKAFFEPGTTVDTNTGRLINTDTTGAENVTLQLLDGTTDTAITVGDFSQVSNNTGFVDVSSGSAVLPYFVQYYAEDNNVTAGAVASQVTYSISYK